MGKLKESVTFLFGLLLLLVTQLYYLFGVEGHRTNTFGVLIMILPLVFVAFWTWRRWRGGE